MMIDLSDVQQAADALFLRELTLVHLEKSLDGVFTVGIDNACLIVFQSYRVEVIPGTPDRAYLTGIRPLSEVFGLYNHLRKTIDNDDVCLWMALGECSRVSAIVEVPRADFAWPFHEDVASIVAGYYGD